LPSACRGADAGRHTGQDRASIHRRRAAGETRCPVGDRAARLRSSAFHLSRGAAAGLLGDLETDHFDTIEARATDGFVSQIPLALIARGARDGAVAWIAAEDPAQPWPPLPHKTVSAGPFYLIWEHPERSGVTTEQWPYQLASLTFVDSPLHRWPQLALPATLPPDALAQRGQTVFLTQCLPCHRLNGGGGGEVGPDLGRPMSPTQYLTDSGLHAIIRNTRAVRTWPGQQMEVFSKAALPDADLHAVVTSLHAMAK
jgi:mono/diheme cytochrome c family protein